jgi:hypothetical protein
MLLYIMWVGVAINVAGCAMSVAARIRRIRDHRISLLCRQQTFAYEKELRERGITLPARCVACCQVLPGHVAGCVMEDIYKRFDWVVEALTRPSIKDLPLNKPADVV